MEFCFNNLASLEIDKGKNTRHCPFPLKSISISVLLYS